MAKLDNRPERGNGIGFLIAAAGALVFYAVLLGYLGVHFPQNIYDPIALSVVVAGIFGRPIRRNWKLLHFIVGAIIAPASLLLASIVADTFPCP
ncbi:MAG: hypothetical protein AB8G18_19265 [Gammaproteobacteria bacterium]